METKVSVIIPIYNAADYLRQCLDSVVKQTYRNIQIICIDAGSADGSVDILDEYMDRDVRIQCQHVENKGVAYSRNAGLDAAEGEYILFVDADDWMDEDTIEIALTEAKSTGAEIVMWPYCREYASKSLPKKIFRTEYHLFEGKDVKKWIHRRYIGIIGKELAWPENADALCTVWGKLYQADLIKENDVRFIDLQEIGTYEDGLFNLYVTGYAEKVLYIQKYLYHYRRDNPDSITTNYKGKLFHQWKHLFQLMKCYIEEHQLPQYYEMALNNRICLSVLGLGLNLLASDKTDREKLSELKNILSDPMYTEAFRYFDMRYLKMHWKLFYGAAKYRQVILVFILLKVICRIITR